MSAACYPEAIRRVLASEGGYVNHPSDPGGETNFGITIAVARANGYQGPMRLLPVSIAQNIYRQQYAVPVHFDEDPAGLDYTLFDYAVNSGPSRANKVLRRVCSLPDDAPWPDTFSAIAKRDPKTIISTVNAERLRFLQSLKTWPVFGKGWGPRVQSVNAASLRMAANGTVPVPSRLPPVAPSADQVPQGKGQVPKPDITKPIVVGGGGTGAAGSATWWDWITAHPVASVCIAVAVLIVVIVVAELVVRRWQAAKQDAPTPGLIPVPEFKSA